jgi:anthranilate phosphoribosyltransferase
MIREAIGKIVKRLSLTEGETRKVFEEIMSGQATPAQIGSFLTALRINGETVDEITAAAKVMREKSLKINIDEGVIVDTCGTGGSGADTFNISTAAAFVAAGCGVKIAKHGNRGASSACGSADVLEALGVNLDAGAEIAEKCIREIGIAFLYAPLFHGAMRYAIAPRKEIGIRTIFNILGPLSNPANARGQVIGVYDAQLTETLARVSRNLGTRRAFIVHGMDGLDEITLSGKTKVAELKEGRIKTYYISPEKFGLKRAKLDKLKGGTAKDNARILLSLLQGEKSARRDVVLLNASAALVAGFKAKNFKDGIRLAENSIDSRIALEKLQRLIGITNKR